MNVVCSLGKSGYLFIKTRDFWSREQIVFCFRSSTFEHECLWGTLLERLFDFHPLGNESSSFEVNDEGVETSCVRVETGVRESIDNFSPWGSSTAKTMSVLQPFSLQAAKFEENCSSGVASNLTPAEEIFHCGVGAKVESLQSLLV